ncbi:hypothetical protein BaRGS_00027544 [Batillaria attramentaria]|uniref:RING-type domain-containing protein n=1 Tax=Batillaria attramentaria TaxID=370345 RepID=A0ABD0K268_9CAEN
MLFRRPARLPMLSFLSLSAVYLMAQLYEAGQRAWLGDAYDPLGEVVDPDQLGDHVLKALLDDQGVLYSRATNRSQLIQLLTDTGHLYWTQVQELAPSPKFELEMFHSGSQFESTVTSGYERVTWMVLVVEDLSTHLKRCSTSEPAGPMEAFSYVANHVNRYGIRVGLFDCSAAQGYCEQVGWLKEQILLVVPQDKQSNCLQRVMGRWSLQTYKVAIHTYEELFQPELLLKWVFQTLREKVVEFRNKTQLDQWMSGDARCGQSDPDIRVLYLTKQDSVPVFLSLISIEYQDVLKVGVVRGTDDVFKDVEQRDQSPKFPKLWFLSRQGIIYDYGHAKWEHFVYPHVTGFLRFFAPSSVDCIFVSVALLSVMLRLEALTVSDPQDRTCSWTRCAVAFVAAFVLVCAGEYFSCSTGVHIPFFNLAPFVTMCAWAPVFRRSVYSLMSSNVFRVFILVPLITEFLGVNSLCERLLDFVRAIRSRGSRQARAAADANDDTQRRPTIPTRSARPRRRRTEQAGDARRSPTRNGNATSDDETDGSSVTLRESPARMRGRPVPMMIIDRNGRMELFPLHTSRPCDVTTDYIDRLPTWEYQPADSLAADEGTGQATAAEEGHFASGHEHDPTQTVKVEKDETVEYADSEGHGANLAGCFPSAASRRRCVDDTAVDPHASSGGISSTAVPFRQGSDAIREARETSKLPSALATQQKQDPKDSRSVLPETRTPHAQDATMGTSARSTLETESALPEPPTEPLALEEMSRGQGQDVTMCANADSTLDADSESTLPEPSTESRGSEEKPQGQGQEARYPGVSECVICLEKFLAGEKLRGLPCTHAFHDACIRHWLLGGNHNCPVCRKLSFNLPPRTQDE